MSYSALMAHTGFFLAGTSSPGTNPPGTSTATTSADDGDGGNAFGAIAQLGILLLIPVGMYFLMIRPQRRRMREQQELQKALDVGDEIITTSGLFGFVTGFDGDRVWVEIDENVQVRVARAAIQGKVDTSDEPQAGGPAPSSSSTDTASPS